MARYNQKDESQKRTERVNALFTKGEMQRIQTVLEKLRQDNPKFTVSDLVVIAVLKEVQRQEKENPDDKPSDHP
jgi:hypothetical protein